jgi:hypothetical protein
MISKVILPIIKNISWQLFLDDERFPADDNPYWIIARNAEIAKKLCHKNGLPYYVSFDHDLGEAEDGYHFAKWLIDQHLDGNKLPRNFSYYVHSQNPVGKMNIETFIDNFMRIMNEDFDQVGDED